MKILFLGDVVGRAGRDAVTRYLPDIRARLSIDFVIINGENAAGGYGITGEICRGLYQVGADVVTLGNHAWDQRETIGYIESDSRLLRPLNYPAGTPGRGAATYKTKDGRTILVIQLMTRLFMDALDCPFAAVKTELQKYQLGNTVNAIVVDIHGEATSEKQAMGVYLDGVVSLAVGSHTHVPTADARVLPKGTGFQTDAGMCGDYVSVIGMEPTVAVERFVRKLPTARLEPAQGDGMLCGVLVETDERSGLAKSIAPLRVGKGLTEAWPDR
ncbi:MAG: YmdB family metallophosphoesterase [Alphaproteobacteria bacterium]|nr:YmdB family metallophosphoesterase [Alphaproteobacteria bacterium]